MSLCLCGCKTEVPLGRRGFIEGHKPKTRGPRRTAEEKLAEYLQEKHEAEERARKRAQKKKDHAHYIAAKKRKRARDLEARRLARLQEQQNNALEKARKAEDVRRAVEEESFSRLTRHAKLAHVYFKDGQRVAEAEIEQLKKQIEHLQQLLKQQPALQQ